MRHNGPFPCAPRVRRRSCTLPPIQIASDRSRLATRQTVPHPVRVPIDAHFRARLAERRLASLVWSRQTRGLDWKRRRRRRKKESQKEYIITSVSPRTRGRDWTQKRQTTSPRKSTTTTYHKDTWLDRSTCCGVLLLVSNVYSVNKKEHEKKTAIFMRSNQNRCQRGHSFHQICSTLDSQPHGENLLHPSIHPSIQQFLILTRVGERLGWNQQRVLGSERLTIAFIIMTTHNRRFAKSQVLAVKHNDDAIDLLWRNKEIFFTSQKHNCDSN